MTNTRFLIDQDRERMLELDPMKLHVGKGRWGAFVTLDVGHLTFDVGTFDSVREACIEVARILANNDDVVAVSGYSNYGEVEW